MADTGIVLQYQADGAEVSWTQGPCTKKGKSKLLSKTENYCPRFVRKLIPALLGLPARGVRLTTRDRKRVTLMVDPSPGVADSELMIAIKTLHSNLGHPSSRALARAIKLSGGTDEAVKCALNFRCTTCARLKEPKPVNPAKLNKRWKNFQDLVCVDLFTLADIEETLEAIDHDRLGRYERGCGLLNELCAASMPLGRYKALTAEVRRTANTASRRGGKGEHIE